MSLSRLSLQRRRLYSAGLLVYLAGLRAAGMEPLASVDLGALQIALIASTVAILVYALVVLLFYPLRSLIESTAAGALTTALASTGGLLPAMSQPLSGAQLLAAWLAFSALWHLALYGAWWQAVPLRLDWRTRRGFVTSAAPTRAWAVLVPNPAAPGDHYSGTFLGQESVAGAPDTVVERTSAGPGLVQESTICFEVKDPPRRLAYRYQAGRDPVDAEYGTGRFDLSLADHPKGTCVTFQETVGQMVVPTALMLWFDDFGGEIRMSMRAALEGTRDRTRWLRDRRIGQTTNGPSQP